MRSELGCHPILPISPFIASKFCLYCTCIFYNFSAIKYYGYIIDVILQNPFILKM